MKEEIIAYGHENITAKHRTTFQITKDEEISLRADCIIAVSSNKAINDLDEEFKNELRDDNSILKIIIKVDDLKDEIIAYGSKNLILNHDRDIVIRRSNFIDSRTLAIKSNKAAKDIDRRIIDRIRDRKKRIKFLLYIL